MTQYRCSYVLLIFYYVPRYIYMVVMPAALRISPRKHGISASGHARAIPRRPRLLLVDSRRLRLARLPFISVTVSQSAVVTRQL